MVTAITLLSILGILYAYVVYPLMLRILLQSRAVLFERARRARMREKSSLPPRSSITSVSIIVAARNEERVIEGKLNDLLRLDVPNEIELYEILVASDASDDRTDELVRSFEQRGVKLVRSPERRGKECAQKRAAAEARGELLIFTDAKVRLAQDAVVRLLPYFSDYTVGAVSSVDKVESVGDEESGEGAYVRYEMWLRELETAFGSVVGLSGSCFAVLRDLCPAMPTDIPSDFALLIESQRQGLRGVSAPDVHCYYRAVKSEEEEFQRKVRTVLRGMTAFFASVEILDPGKYGWFAWQAASHKLIRWLVPWFFVLGTLGSLQLGNDSLFFLLSAFGFVSVSLLALSAYQRPELRKHTLFRIPLFFCVANLAIAFAWVRFMKGERAITWQPSAKPV